MHTDGPDYEPEGLLHTLDAALRPLATLESPINRQSLAYWVTKRGDRRMPSRGDLDPTEMTEFLPYVILLDVERDPLDFRYRLIGTIMDEHMNDSYTGKHMSEIAHQKPPSIIWSSCKHVVDTLAPYSSNAPYVGKHKDFKQTEDILMPLSEDDENVSMLFVTAAFL